jgi:hypothetical protein
LFVAAFAALAASACQDLRSALDPADLEQRLRNDPGRPGKVGSIVGVATQQRATRIADEVRRSPDPDCAIQIRPGDVWTLQLRMERRRSDTVVAFWDETRTYRRDSDGNRGQELQATFRTRIGEAGERKMAWRLIDGHSYVAESSGHQLRWYARRAEQDEESRLERTAAGTFQGLLDAVDGWTRAGDGQWREGDDPLRCVATDEGDGFVVRFVAGAQTEEASLIATASSWRLSARWRLTDQTEIVVQAEARLEAFDGTVVPPDRDQLVDVSPEHSYSRSRSLLENLANDHLIELTSTIGKATNDTQPTHP